LGFLVGNKPSGNPGLHLNLDDGFEVGGEKIVLLDPEIFVCIDALEKRFRVKTSFYSIFQKICWQKVILVCIKERSLV
jgi:hypothetical protein